MSPTESYDPDRHGRDTPQETFGPVVKVETAAGGGIWIAAPSPCTAPVPVRRSSAPSERSHLVFMEPSPSDPGESPPGDHRAWYPGDILVAWQRPINELIDIYIRYIH